MRLLASLLASCLVLPACAADDPELDPVELTNGNGKQDGGTSNVFVLSPDKPAPVFEARCNEWINCDLTLEVTVGNASGALGNASGVTVTVTRASDDLAVELTAVRVSCIESNGAQGANTVLVAIGQPVPAANQRCRTLSETEPQASSPDAKERFTITVAKQDWAAGATGFYVALIAMWH